MRKIEKIIIHCSASTWGNVSVIRKWHKKRGFSDIGYHKVILNGYETYEDFMSKNKQSDGLLELGRPESVVGAHVKGMNTTSIGICLIGIDKFSWRQKWTLIKLVLGLMKEYKLKVEDVLGHYECPTGKEQGKTCPNFNMNTFRRILRFFYFLKNH